MNKILFWIVIVAVAVTIITMMLIALAPYIAAALVLYLVCKSGGNEEPGTQIITVEAREPFPPARR